ALRGLAVPPTCKVGVEVVLHVVHRVEHDHACHNRNLVRDLGLLTAGDALQHVHRERLTGETTCGECRLGRCGDCDPGMIHDGHYFPFLGLRAAAGCFATAVAGAASVR